jgi:hypothetical protein
LEEQLAAYCGLYCGACEILIAIKNNKLEEKAREWQRRPEDMNCSGCKSSVTNVFCTDCTFKNCAKSKGISFCSECQDYPCKQLLDFQADRFPHHKIILKNLDSIHILGMTTWLDRQKNRWSCPKCGTEFAWYSTQCSSCGQKVDNCETEVP